MAQEITAAGGVAETARVDALDEQAVEAHADGVARRAGRLDISFNAIGIPQRGVQGIPLLALSPEQFSLPIMTYPRAQFLTAHAAARQMAPRQRGAIVLLSASLSGKFVPFMSGITAACGAVEALTRTLAAEFGPAGVRVNCVRAGGLPETRTIRETSANMARTFGADPRPEGRPPVGNVLARPLTVEETAATVAFVASERASGIAGQVINVCGGELVS